MTKSQQREHGWRLWALALLCVAPFFSIAQNASVAPLGQGELHYSRPDWPQPVQAPVLDTEVQIDVTGIVARVRIKQHFTNLNSQWVHARYLFPLPPDAAVDSLIMQAGEQRIEGEIQPRQVAQQMFEQAQQRGQKASLVSQQKANLFTTEMANLAPGETVSVTITYQQVVRYQDERYRLRLPMAITPRFENHQQVQSQSSRLSQHIADAPERQARVSVNLQPGFDLAGLSSPYHNINASKEASNRYSINLAKGQRANKAFELQWWPRRTSEPQSHIISDGEYGLLMLIPPSKGPAIESPRELVLILDISGSMQGESLRQAKAAVSYALQQLHSHETFNLLLFNDEVYALWPQAQPASQDNIDLALRQLNRIEANGGTNIASALRAVLTSPESQPALRQLVFVTDGSVGQEQELVAYLSEHLAENRLFTVGIGSAPNSLFMQEAALAGRGSFTYIASQNQVEKVMKPLLNRLSHVALTNLATDGIAAMGHYPEVIPDIYLGEPVVISFRLDNPEPIDLTVSGDWQGERWSQKVSVSATGQERGLDKLWAKHKIDDLTRQRRLTDSQDQRQFTDQQITDIALEYGLVSEFTSLIAIDKTPLDAQDQVVQHTDIPATAPEGYQHRLLPQGATGWQRDILLGALLMVMGYLTRRVYATAV